MSGPATEDDAAPREHEPTPARLEEARREGHVARSADLTQAAATAGVLAALAGFGATMAGTLGTAGAVLLDQAHALAPLFRAGGPLPAGLIGAVGIGAAPLLLLPGLAAIAALLAQRALVVAPSNLAPRLSRLSPLANARQKFGPAGLFHFAKSAAKLGLVGGLLWVFLLARLPETVGLAALGPAAAATRMAGLLVGFLAVCTVLAAAFGVVDLLWQRAAHLRRLRMTRRELLEELRRSEGDPQVKQERRRRGHAIATNRMLADVPKADVVIVNPTHVAVALRWRRGDRGAPRCLAKGVDAVAARIREAAVAAGVPIHRDAATARALHATVEVGEEIRPEHYRAVAAAIRFAEAMQARARRAGRPRRDRGARPVS